jgi:hypothetical protein
MAGQVGFEPTGVGLEATRLPLTDCPMAPILGVEPRVGFHPVD